jgi:hypothetical protein
MQGVVVERKEDLMVGVTLVGLAVGGRNVNQSVTKKLNKLSGLIPRYLILI